MNRTVDASYREAIASYREAAASLSPRAVSEYLALSPWDLERRDPIKEIWQLKGDNGKAISRLMLPLDADYIDFKDRFYDAIFTLARINDWDAGELQEQILSARADLFYVRLVQATSDGTIPFKQAEATIEAIHKMVRSAASATASANGARKGQLPAAVSNFMDDDVRLGHTKRGSFIFTVATRLNDRLVASQSVPEAAAAAEMADHVVFSRQVMETLALDLEAAHDAIAASGDKGISPTIPDSLDDYFLESLEELAQPEGLQSVEMSFQWAAAVPRPTVGSEPVVLDHSALPAISEVRERVKLLREEANASRFETLVGPVLSLARENYRDSGTEAGEVVILAAIGKHKPKQVHVQLTGEDHEWAIQAYKFRLPLVVKGILVFTRRRWRLTGEVELDTSFLKHQLPRA